jgi:hypothetical protein
MMMRRSGRPAWLVAGVIGAAGAFLGGASCNNTSVTRLSGATDAQGVCPATPAETIGVSCAPNGLVCAPAYPCGLSEGTLQCTCSGGAFQCVDENGNAIDSADAATCPRGEDAGGSCPSSELAAESAPCHETGVLCAYPSSCPAAFDQCQCFPAVLSDGGLALQFTCTPATCVNPDAALIAEDAEPDSPGLSEDAPSDAPAPFGDAASDATASGPDSTSPVQDARPDVSAVGDAGVAADSSGEDAASDGLSSDAPADSASE